MQNNIPPPNDSATEICSRWPYSSTGLPQTNACWESCLLQIERGWSNNFHPLQVVYKDLHFGGSLAGTQRFVASQCCFDPRRAELCIASRTAETSFISCFSKSGKPSQFWPSQVRR